MAETNLGKITVVNEYDQIVNKIIAGDNITLDYDNENKVLEINSNIDDALDALREAINDLLPLDIIINDPTNPQLPEDTTLDEIITRLNDHKMVRVYVREINSYYCCYPVYWTEVGAVFSAVYAGGENPDYEWNTIFVDIEESEILIVKNEV